MTITTNDARNEYTATASQTVFNYTFKIFASTDLLVYQTPSGQTPNDSTDLIATYTVDPGTIGDASGGFITLDTGASAGDLITIVSNVPDSRTTDYQVNGNFVPGTVNDDFDRVVQLVKQLKDVIDRVPQFENALQAATGLTFAKPEASKFLRWKSDASGIENVNLNTSEGATNAAAVSYDNTTSGTASDDVQGVIDEIKRGDNFTYGNVQSTDDITVSWEGATTLTLYIPNAGNVATLGIKDFGVDTVSTGLVYGKNSSNPGGVLTIDLKVSGTTSGTCNFVNTVFGSLQQQFFLNGLTSLSTGGETNALGWGTELQSYVKHTFDLPPIIPEYTVAGVPTASTYDNGVIIVSNETGGRTLATSDGTNWRRVSDGAIIS